MAKAFDTSNVGGSTTAASSGTVDITAAAVGAVVFVCVELGALETSMTMTGWNLLESQDTNSTSHHGIFWRAKLAGDTTFTVSWSPNTAKHRWGWVSYTGLNTTTPVESYASAIHATGGSVTFASASGTPTAADRWALGAAYVRSTTTIFDVDVWSGEVIDAAAATERRESSSTSSTNPWCSIVWADSATDVTQAAHTFTATCDRSEANGGAAIMFLIPSAAAVSVTADATGIRIGIPSVTGVSVGVNTADAPSALRVGLPSATSVRIDSGATDTPSGLRMGVSAASVVYDSAIPDAPNGLRLGMSAVSTLFDVLSVADTTGIRIGLPSSASVVVGIAVADVPIGIRLGSSTVSVLFDLSIVDTPTGSRVGVSTASVNAGTTGDVTATDTPFGLRLSSSSSSVLIGSVVADVPRGLKIGSSQTSVVIDLVVSDKPNAIRLGSSFTSTVFDTRVTDLPSGFRLGVSSASVLTGTLDTIVADTAWLGLRVGLSFASAVVPTLVIDVVKARGTTTLTAERVVSSIGVVDVVSSVSRTNVTVDIEENSVQN